MATANHTGAAPAHPPITTESPECRSVFEAFHTLPLAEQCLVLAEVRLLIARHRRGEEVRP
jgi:hypothetical protein